MASNWKFTEWYKAHGSELNESRRSRYKEDPEYRKQVLAANKESRLRRRKEQLKERAQENDAKEFKTKQQWKTIDMEVDGKVLKLVTIGALASVLGRSKLGVRLLEKKGVIPPAAFHNEQGERLYTPEQVIEIRGIIEAKGMLERKKTTGVPENFLVHIKLSDGTVVQCWVSRIGVLAKSVGRSTITLEQMERRGAIPSTSLRLPPNRRVFTSEQIEAVKKAFDKRGNDLRSETDKTALKAEITEAWKELKLVGAKVLDVVSKKKDEK